MGITTLVFSSLFKREKKMYGSRDMKFLVPVSFKMLLSLCLAAVVWTVPILMVARGGALSNWFTILVTFAPPVGFTALVSKPNVIFNNKTFYSWMYCNIKYLFQPKCYADGKKCNVVNGSHLDCDYVIWLGDPSYDGFWESEGGRNGKKRKKAGR